MAKSINLDEFEDVDPAPTRGFDLSEFEDVSAPASSINLSEFEDVATTYAVPPVSASMFAMPSLGDVGEEYRAAGLAAARLGTNVVAGASNFGNTVNANLLELMPFDFAQNLAGRLRQTTGRVEGMRQRVNRDYLTPNVVADPLSETGGQIAAAAVPTTVALMAGAPAWVLSGIGAAMGAGQGYSTAKDYGATDEQAAISGAANALINTSDAALGGRVSSAINPMLQAGLAVGRGAAINAGQEVLSNLEAKYLSGYDPNRAITENVAPSAIIGGGMTLAGNTPRINTGGVEFARQQAEAARIRDVEAQQAQAALDAANAERAAVEAQRDAIARQYANIGSDSAPPPRPNVRMAPMPGSEAPTGVVDDTPNTPYIMPRQLEDGAVATVKSQAEVELENKRAADAEMGRQYALLNQGKSVVGPQAEAPTGVVDTPPRTPPAMPAALEGGATATVKTQTEAEIDAQREASEAAGRQYTLPDHGKSVVGPKGSGGVTDETLGYTQNDLYPPMPESLGGEPAPSAPQSPPARPAAPVESEPTPTPQTPPEPSAPPVVATDAATRLAAGAGASEFHPEKQRRLAAFAEANKGKPAEEVQIAMVRAGLQGQQNTIKPLAIAISEHGDIVADQLRINADRTEQQGKNKPTPEQERQREIADIQKRIAQTEAEPIATTRTSEDVYGNRIQRKRSPQELADAEQKKQAFLAKQRARLKELAPDADAATDTSPPQRTETATPGTDLGSTPPPVGGKVVTPPSREVGSDAPRQAATPPGERLQKEFAYRLTLRPASPVTTPDGALRYDNDGTQFGSVVYNKPLTQEQIEHFSLEPLDANDPINIKKSFRVETDAIDKESDYGDKGFTVGGDVYSPDTRRGGDAWRVTMFTEQGRPSGHVEFDSYVEARDSAAAARARQNRLGERLSAPATTDPTAIPTPTTGLVAEIDAAMKLDPIKARTELRRIEKRLGGRVSNDTLSDLEAKLRAKATNPPPGTEMELGSGVPGIGLANKVGKAVLDAGRGALRYFSEELPDRLQRLSRGETGKKSARMFRSAVDTYKKTWGEMSTVLDPALDLVRKNTPSTRWLHGFAKTGNDGDWAMNNAQQFVEGKVAAPAEHAATANALRDANVAIAQKFEPYDPTGRFKASSKFQRNWTVDAMEAIASGEGPMYEKIVKAYAEANNKPVSEITKHFAELKSQIDADATGDGGIRINQEFMRQFENAPTHVKVNGEWQEVLHASPFRYLEHAGKRIAGRIAVKTAFGDDIKTIRDATIAELPDASAFDEPMRAIHGLPAQPTTRSKIPVVSEVYRGIRGIGNYVFRPLSLTMSSINNLPESIVGGAGPLLGYRRAAKAAARIRGESAAMEQIGMVDRAFYDHSVNPSNMWETAGRKFKNVVTSASAQRVFNEAQEAHAAATMQVAVDDMKAGKIKGFEARMFGQFIESIESDTFKGRGLEMARGKGTADEYQKLLRKSASYFTGGNKTTVEGSRFQGNRLLQEILPFQHYGVVKANQLRKSIGQVGDAYASYKGNKGNWKDVAAASINLARMLGSTTAQGGAAMALRAVIFGGGAMGLETLYSEMKDDGPMVATAGMLFQGISGPGQSLFKIASTPSEAAGNITDMKVMDFAFVGQAIKQMIQATEKSGPFRDMSNSEAAVKFMKMRVPALRAADLVLGAYGLSDTSPKMDAAVSSFYRWQRDADRKAGSYVGPIKAENVVFRQHMRRAYIAMKGGKDPEAIKKHLLAAGEAKSFDDLPESLRDKRILYKYGFVPNRTKPEVVKRNIEMLQSLHKRIGPQAYEKLVEHDTIITIMTEQNLGGRSKMELPWTPPTTKD